MTSDLFYAKIMLFGEYSVIWDSMALTIPYAHFTGKLSFFMDEQYTKYDFARESNRQLRDYLTFLRSLDSVNDSQFRLDLDQLERDIEKGLYFESNIPQGYGIGSSGALVAAIYDEYVASADKRKIITTPEISRLKEIFSRMEAYFHGVSSGIDPLLCYIRYPLLIRNKLLIETVKIPRDKFGQSSAIFLLDTGVHGKTGPLVSLFYEKCKESKFMEHVRQVFIPANNGCIENLLAGNMQLFFERLGELSFYQFEYLSELIPEFMKPVWKKGLERDDFKLKLCGSGGGGFLLGISCNFDITRKFFMEQGMDLIPVYKNG